MWLANKLFSPWIYASADSMLDSAVARLTEPHPFPNRLYTSGKIHFYFFQDGRLLIHEFFDVQISGRSPEARSAEISSQLYEPLRVMRGRIRDCPLNLGSQIHLVIQAVAYNKFHQNPNPDLKDPWLLPCVNYEGRIGPFAGAAYAVPGGLYHPDDIQEARKRVIKNLNNYNSILQIPDEVLPDFEEIKAAASSQV